MLKCDQLVWNGNDRGVYSVREGYQVLHTAWPVECDIILWHNAAVPRHSVCMWRLLHKNLMMLDILKSRGNHLASWCTLCEKDEETIGISSSIASLLLGCGLWYL